MFEISISHWPQLCKGVVKQHLKHVQQKSLTKLKGQTVQCTFKVRTCSPETIEKLSENGSDDVLAGLSCRGSEDSGNEDIENR